MRFTLDTHTHTIASGHAYNTIDEMAVYAAGHGVTHLAITDHAPKMPGSAGVLYFSNMGIIPRKKYGVNIYMGCEVNIMDYDGRIDLSNAMDNPYVNIIGHPDDSRYPVDYEQLVRAAGEKHVLLELNNTSLSPTGPRQGAYDNDVTMLKLCKEAGVCISIGSDAHIKESICDFDRAYKVIEEVGFPKELIVNSNTELYESYIGKRQ